jgi:hypothetical protein
MSEQVPSPGPQDTEPQEAAPMTEDGSRSTGTAAVDRVLEDLDQLDETPLEEHLGAFERAHESLRSALDADPGDPGDPA